MEPMDSIELSQRLASIESKLDAILGHLGLAHPMPPAGTFSAPTTDARLMPDVMQYVHEGKLIQAIKVYRERTGLGLRDAKNAVDAAVRSVR